MATVSVQQAQKQLPQLIEQAASGEEVMISRDGAVFCLILVTPDPAYRKPYGMLEGSYDVLDDIKTPFKKEIDEMFYGTSVSCSSSSPPLQSLL